MKIKQPNGVIFTIEDNVCVDLDIPPDVEVLTLWDEIENLNYKLKGVFKQFPNVRTLEIPKNVNDFEISNFMFPNVENVISYNYRYANDHSLIRKNSFVPVLLNAFCHDGPLTDCDLAFQISDYALEGSLSKELPKRFSSTKKSFFGYVMNAPQEGLSLVDGNIVSYDPTAEEIVIPKEAKNYLENVYLRIAPSGERLKKITITDGRHFSLLPHLDTITTLNLGDVDPNFDELSLLENVENYEVSDSNPAYKTIDGVMFSKDGSRLVLFPPKRSGHYRVPEGTIVIESHAFQGSSISSVSFPDSLKLLKDRCFSGSAIEKIDFGKGLRQIGSGNNTDVFSKCKKLKSLEIPGTIQSIAANAFDGSSLEEVKLHEGLLEICACAFAFTKLRKIELPASVISLGCNSICGIPEIIWKGDKFLIDLHDFLDSFIFVRCDVSREQIITLRHNGKTIYLPNYIETEDFKKMNIRLLFKTPENILNAVSMSPDMKEDMILKLWDDIQSPVLRNTYAEVLRKGQTKIGSRLIEENREQDLVKFLKTGAVSSACARKLLNKIPERMVSARSCVLNMQPASKNSYHL